ncbi:diamine acetyltransferase 2-like [Diaphorina citri]|uniref:Diamine acetyltransferase 2-like n=1 Tax=Diaphorina citri TaxID=121845 RepID=A0A3Q0JN58_DIACI|nr:diamine acetyltransferase 2-like [Diaphorina citri]
MASTAVPENVIIRPAIRSDCAEIYRLIQELAVFEKMPNAVKITQETLEKDGFESQPPLWKAFVAEVKEKDTHKNGATVTKLVGMALYSFSYSSWKGLRTCLDHVFVTDQYRQYDIEKNLYETYIKAGVDMIVQADWFVCPGMPARHFYEKLGAINIHEQGRLACLSASIRDTWLRYCSK